MKTWLLGGFVVLGCLLASCKQEENAAQPSTDPPADAWVMYPPLSIIEASPKNHPAGDSVGNRTADSLRAVQFEILRQEALKGERLPAKAAEQVKPQ